MCMREGREDGTIIAFASVVSTVSLVDACLFVHSGPGLLLQATKRTTLFCIVERVRTVRNFVFSYAATIARNGSCLSSIPFFFFRKYVESRRMFVGFHDYTENNFGSVCDSEKKKMKNYFEVSSALRPDTLEVKW